MFITKVKVALSFAANVSIVHVIVPLDSEQLNAGPVFWLKDTKVIPAGTVSVSDTLAAASGPRFLTSTVNETSLPGVAEAGPVLITLRSAPGTPGLINREWTASDTRGTTIRTRAAHNTAANERIRTDI